MKKRGNIMKRREIALVSGGICFLLALLTTEFIYNKYGTHFVPKIIYGDAILGVLLFTIGLILIARSK